MEVHAIDPHENCLQHVPFLPSFTMYSIKIYPTVEFVLRGHTMKTI
jgi:hypothetical protein